MDPQYLSNCWLHLKKILTHKRWVFKYCAECGLIWRGITHDLSKFSPTEFFESVKYYRGDESPINACKADKGYSLAWQHHKGRNPHHYEYWIDKVDSGGVSIKMPLKYLTELICDYLGAARAYLGDDFTYIGELEWWKTKRELCKMHPETKAFLDFVFDKLAKGHELKKVIATANMILKYEVESF